MSALNRAARLWASPSSEVRPNSWSLDNSYRVERRLPPDLPGRASIACRSATVLERVLFRQVGGRHFDGPNQRIARRHLARLERRPADRGGEIDRAIPAPEL